MVTYLHLSGCYFFQHPQTIRVIDKSLLHNTCKFNSHYKYLRKNKKLPTDILDLMQTMQVHLDDKAAGITLTETS